VQRYIGGASLRESRLGLMFNAVFKIPMQFFILLLGALVFVFYQFECPPVYFNEAAWQYQAGHGAGEKLHALERQYQALHSEKQEKIQAWLKAQHAGNAQASMQARAEAVAALERSEATRAEARSAMKSADARTKGNDSDYIFITFILRHLPHGLIGLLVAVIFAAAMSSKASELTALASTTTVDFYKEAFKPDASDAHYVAASKWFTILWGGIALCFALFASLVENLIQAVNILGSIFYGVVLGLFVVAFFLKWVRGSAVFWAALAAQALVFALYFSLNISYLWYNVIGCGACVVLSLLIQEFFDVHAAGFQGRLHSMSATPVICFGSSRAAFFRADTCLRKSRRPADTNAKLGAKSSFSFTTATTTRVRPGPPSGIARPMNRCRSTLPAKTNCNGNSPRCT